MTKVYSITNAVINVVSLSMLQTSKGSIADNVKNIRPILMQAIA